MPLNHIEISPTDLASIFFNRKTPSHQQRSALPSHVAKIYQGSLDN